jgi:hypothetical protein
VCACVWGRTVAAIEHVLHIIQPFAAQCVCIPEFKVQPVTRAELGRLRNKSRGTAQVRRYWVQVYYEIQEYNGIPPSQELRI